MYEGYILVSTVSYLVAVVMFTDMALLVLQLLIEHMMPTDQLWDLVVK